MAYPGSPLIARSLLRRQDRLHLAELHPQEFAALTQSLAAPNVRIVQEDGYDMAQALCPPDPRRGMMLVDPSYEVARDYSRLPAFLSAIHRKWNVGVLMLWYPVLTSTQHGPMLARLEQDVAQGWRHEVRFPPARPGHRMIGSGLFVVNAPYGLTTAGAELSALFDGLA